MVATARWERATAMVATIKREGAASVATAAAMVRCPAGRAGTARVVATRAEVMAVAVSE